MNSAKNRLKEMKWNSKNIQLPFGDIAYNETEVAIASVQVGASKKIRMTIIQYARTVSWKLLPDQKTKRCKNRQMCNSSTVEHETMSTMQSYH